MNKNDISKYRALIVTDLSFGDSGKGATVDFLAYHMKSPMVVRHNGGGQAAHNVETLDGRHHTFSHFGSATFHRTPTYLSRYMIVEPFALIREREVLLGKLGGIDPLNLMTISPDCIITTPFHLSTNRLIEISRGNARHGSCGMGIGETMKDSILYPDDTIYGRDLYSPNILRAKLERVIDRKRAEIAPIVDVIREKYYKDYLIENVDARINYDNLFHITADYLIENYRRFAFAVNWYEDSEFLSHWLDKSGNLIFEGAQGVLLDEIYGFNPHTTWSKTTSHNAHILLDDIGVSKPERHTFGVVRAYMTRHGAGILPTEYLGESSPIPNYDYSRHNPHNMWQGSIRAGALDMPLLRYAIKADGNIDSLVINHIDHVIGDKKFHVVHKYETELSGLDAIITMLDNPPQTYEESLENGVKILSFDFSHICTPSIYTIKSVNDMVDWFISKSGINIPVSILGYGTTLYSRCFSSDTRLHL